MKLSWLAGITLTAIVAGGCFASHRSQAAPKAARRVVATPVRLDPAAAPARVWRGSPAPRERVHVPAGTFWMGERGRGHRVRVAAFQLDVVRVTLDDLSLCGANACPGMTPAEVRCKLEVSHPEFSGTGAADCVSYATADAFCRWHGGRLPTDVEWEYAARGTTGRRFAWGDGAFQDGHCAIGERPPGTPCDVVGRTDDRSPFGVRELGTSGGEWTFTQHCPRDMSACGKVIRGATAVAWEWTSMSVDAVDAAVGFRCAYDVSR